MKIMDVLRRCRRSLTPPGNRGSLESSYKQPKPDGPYISPATVAHQHEQPPTT